MSLTAYKSERDKYYDLLKLSQDQITALETDDMFEFDRILAAKDSIIKSMGNPTSLLESDPGLASVATQIQERDKTAQRLLFEKLGRLKRQMADLKQSQLAKNAYNRTTRSHASLSAVMAVPPDAAKLMDKRA